MGSPFQLRNRVPGKDDPFILKLINENLGHYPSSYGITDKKVLELLNQYSRVILLTKNEEPIGFLSWTEKKDILMLELCVIDQKYQSQGIATSYMKKLEKYALRRGFHTLRFYVDLQNKRAQALYKEFGFYPKRMNPFTGTLLMEKKL